MSEDVVSGQAHMQGGHFHEDGRSKAWLSGSKQLNIITELMTMIAIILLASLAGNLITQQKWEILLAQAEELASQNRNEEASDKYAVALVEAEMSGRNDLPAAIVLDHYAFHLQQLGQLREAIHLYERAFDILVLRAPDSRALTDDVIGLSSVYLEIGDISKAQTLIQRFLDKDGAYRPMDRAMLLANLGSALTAKGDLLKGDYAFKEVLTILEKNGNEQQLIVKTLNNLAGINCVNGHISDAAEYSRRARTLLGEIRNPPPALVIKTLSNAGGIAILGRKWEESQDFYSQALARCEETFGPDHYVMVPILRGYAQALVHLNRKNEAKRANKRAEVILNKFRRENMLGLTVDAGILSQSQGKGGSLWIQ
jgi:tetratricopeptide (TPR) repeat protein